MITSLGTIYTLHTDGYNQNQMVFSPDGTMLAVASKNLIELYDFDSNSGRLTNLRVLDYHSGFVGVAFSPNSLMMYASAGGGEVVQMDVSRGSRADIMNSVLMVGRFRDPLSDVQLAYNGKIYLGKCCGQSGRNMPAINNPNVAGLGCNYTHQGLMVPYEAPYGLPMAVQSFYREAPTLITPNVCIATGSARLSVSSIGYCDSLQWDFGDGQKIMQYRPPSKSITHTYQAPGPYEVRLTRYVGNTEKVLTSMISIDHMPQINLGKDTTLCAGQSLQLSAGSNETFTWSTNEVSPIIHASTEGTYWIEVKNGLCIDKDSLTVRVLPYPALSLDAKQETCEWEHTVSVINNPLYAYNWSTDETTNRITVYQSGIYSVEVSNQHCATELKTEVKFVGIRDFNLLRDQYEIIDSVKAIAGFDTQGGPVTEWMWEYGDGSTETLYANYAQHHYFARFIFW